MLKRVLLPLLILLLAIAGFLALKHSKPEAAPLQDKERIWRVTTMPVHLQTISPAITLYGRVETPRQASLKSAVNADVLTINVLEGDEVEQGQVLIILDDVDAQLVVAHRQADLAEVDALIRSESARFKRDKSLLTNEQTLLKLANNAVDRAEKLEQGRLASKATLDDTLAAQQRQVANLQRLEYDIAEHPARLAGLKARQSRAKALLKQAHIDLQRTQVTAPFTGRVAKLNIAEGDRVRAGDSLLSLYDLTQLEVRAQIPARYRSQVQDNIRQGKQQTATTLLEGQTIDFTLARLSGEIQLDSGGVDGLFRLNSPTNALSLGQFVTLSLQLSEQDSVVAIPFNALYSLKSVYRLDDGYLNLVPVQRVGDYQTPQGEARLLIRSDQLHEGDLLLNTQLPNAITGLRVESLND